MLMIVSRKNFVYYFSFFGVAFFLAWGGLMEYWRIYAPREPDESVGAIYPLNYHGKFVYLTWNEDMVWYLLPSLGICVAIVLLFVTRKR